MNSPASCPGTGRPLRPQHRLPDPPSPFNTQSTTRPPAPARSASRVTIRHAMSASGHAYSSTGKPFTVSMIRWLRYRHRIPAPVAPEGTLSVRQVRERYGVSLWVVHYWIQHGHIDARQRRPGMPHAITITDEIDLKLPANPDQE